jgi:hypothetical protein
MDIKQYDYTLHYKFDVKSYLPFNSDDLDGWNVDYIIAGGFIHDIANGLTPNDIDMWIMTQKGYYELIEYFSTIFTNIKYHIHFIYIEIEADNLPFNIQLIKIFNKTPLSIITNFDMDYIRCYFNGYGIQLTPDCLESWSTKVIRNMIIYNSIRPVRILKSINKGYKFERKLGKFIGMDIQECCENTDIMCSTHSEYWKDPITISNTNLPDDITNNSLKYRLITLNSYEYCILVLPFIFGNPFRTFKQLITDYDAYQPSDNDTALVIINNLINN